jgi:hypothetical protein
MLNGLYINIQSVPRSEYCHSWWNETKRFTSVAVVTSCETDAVVVVPMSGRRERMSVGIAYCGHVVSVRAE